jgi:phage FluMu protein Com
VTLREITRGIRKWVEISVGVLLLLFTIVLVLWDVVKRPFRTPVCNCAKAHTLTTHISTGEHGVVKCPVCKQQDFIPATWHATQFIFVQDYPPWRDKMVDTWMDLLIIRRGQ